MTQTKTYFNVGDKVELKHPLWISNGPFMKGAKGEIKVLNQWDALVEFSNGRVRIDFSSLILL